MSDTLSAAAREAAIGCPEQFLAATTLLRAAAESRRSADLIDDDAPNLAASLRTVAAVTTAAAGDLVAHIAEPTCAAAILAELTHNSRT